MASGGAQVQFYKTQLFQVHCVGAIRAGAERSRLFEIAAQSYPAGGNRFDGFIHGWSISSPRVRHCEVAATQPINMSSVVVGHPRYCMFAVDELSGVDVEVPDGAVAVAQSREQTCDVAAELIVGWVTRRCAIDVN